MCHGPYGQRTPLLGLAGMVNTANVKDPFPRELGAPRARDPKSVLYPSFHQHGTCGRAFGRGVFLPPVRCHCNVGKNYLPGSNNPWVNQMEQGAVFFEGSPFFVVLNGTPKGKPFFVGSTYKKTSHPHGPEPSSRRAVRAAGCRPWTCRAAPGRTWTAAPSSGPNGRRGRPSVCPKAHPPLPRLVSFPQKASPGSQSQF